MGSILLEESVCHIQGFSEAEWLSDGTRVFLSIRGLMEELHFSPVCRAFIEAQIVYTKVPCVTKHGVS